MRKKIDNALSALYAERMPSATDYFHQGFNCAQSVFAACAPHMGLSETAALKLASGFGAGVGRMRGLCGAFSGLTLVAGYCRGNLTGSPEDKEKIFSLVREQADAFRREFGSLTCRELLHLEENRREGAKPSERTEAYYNSRPCERCVAFCEAQAKSLLQATADDGNGGNPSGNR